MRKIGKARQAKFYKAALKILEHYGAVKSNGAFDYGWNLKTKAGNLLVSIHDENNYVFSIFCRFDNVNKAQKILDSHAKSLLDPNSGKWNFYSKDDEAILYNFNSELELIV